MTETPAILVCLPVFPSWGVKKNSQGKSEYWFGYKAHLFVSNDMMHMLSMKKRIVSHLNRLLIVKKLAKNEGEIDEFFAPTYLREILYKYDSFDKRYEALKFIMPETTCREWPLLNGGMCQKVIKIQQSTNVRRYSQPACGTKAWHNLYKKHSSVERVNAYTKGYYQLNSTRFIAGVKVQIKSLVK